MGTDDSISGSTMLVVDDRCLSTTIDGEAVILHTDSGQYYGFNEVATYLWDQLQDPQSIDELCHKVANEFDVVPSRCRDDVREYVTELLEYELIRIAD